MTSYRMKAVATICVEDAAYIAEKYYVITKISSLMPVVNLIMNDCHYYLSDYLPSFDCNMYISGINFYPVPGRYVLPEREGAYVIYKDTVSDVAMVAMKTCGSDTSYSHPLVQVLGADLCIDSGWIKSFQKIHAYKFGDASPI